MRTRVNMSKPFGRQHVWGDLWHQDGGRMQGWCADSQRRLRVNVSRGLEGQADELYIRTWIWQRLVLVASAACLVLQDFGQSLSRLKEYCIAISSWVSYRWTSPNFDVCLMFVPATELYVRCMTAISTNFRTVLYRSSSHTEKVWIFRLGSTSVPYFLSYILCMIWVGLRLRYRTYYKTYHVLLPFLRVFRIELPITSIRYDCFLFEFTFCAGIPIIQRLYECIMLEASCGIDVLLCTIACLFLLAHITHSMHHLLFYSSFRTGLSITHIMHDCFSLEVNFCIELTLITFTFQLTSKLQYRTS